MSFLSIIHNDFSHFLLVTIFLIGLNSLLTVLSFLVGGKSSVLERNSDFNFGTLNLFDQITHQGGTWALVLSLFLCPLAAFFSATNDRLAPSIRLLLIAENLNKFIFVITNTLGTFCVNEQPFPLDCPEVLITYWQQVNIFLHGYDFVTAAKYCQLMISLSRFFAVSFDGRYFRSTQKWSWVQLLIPNIATLGLVLINELVGSTDTCLHSYIYPGVLLIMCSLDAVTGHKMTHLRKHGKVSKAEGLLMLQMLSSTVVILISTIGSVLVLLLIELFATNLLIYMFYHSLLPLSDSFLFIFLQSLIMIFCLRKRKDKKRISKVSTANEFRPVTRVR
ncbi:unnamed protein product, partial [Mesorhabditis belari]|uniref:Uncharacterized protein n=1 Tax=Mesorhabditis belari TaxID=2138241 RepID=A0AAF3EM47_9BILA